jgi:hypothetical protein
LRRRLGVSQEELAARARLQDAHHADRVHQILEHRGFFAHEAEGFFNREVFWGAFGELMPACRGRATRYRCGGMRFTPGICGISGWS